MREHYKLYKAGKLWLTTCIATLGIFAASSVQADSQQPETTATTQIIVAAQNDEGSQVTSSDNSTQMTNTNMPENINGYTQQVNTNGTTTWQNANGQLANGWQTNQNNWYYFNNGQSTTDWQYINNNWYYLNPNSYAMETGLQTINSSKYYLNEKHDGTYGAMQTGWQLLNNNWYYFANNGAASTGWQRLNNNWYYFDPSTAIMQAGLKQINNHGYYLNDQIDGTYGAMKYGWQKINGRWYGFGGANDGSAYTGWQKINNHWYYFNNDGEARTGWQTINNQRYYFDLTNAWTVSGWQNIDGNWYYFDPANSWARTGWQEINGSWYYLDPTTYQMMTGSTLINGEYYFFDENGKQKTGLIFNPTTGLLQYYDVNNGVRLNSANIDGQNYLFDSLTGDIITNNLADGLIMLGNNHYYFAKDKNQFITNVWKNLNGAWYYFNNEAKATTGWYQSPAGFWYYFNQDGRARTGWQSINGKWYLFDQANANSILGWYQSPAGYWYYFDPENAYAHTGWTFAGHDWYYMDPVNANMWTGGHWIDGHWVNLGSNGAFVGFNQRVINWFLSREGKLTYSMYGSRNGRDGTADCSGSMTQAVWSAGGSTPSRLYSTLDLGNYLLQNGYYLAGRGNGVQNVQYGDIVIWGTPGASAGGADHTVVISTAGESPKCISTCGYYWGLDPNSRYGASGQAVQEFDYQWYWNIDDRPYQMVYRPNFYWA